MLLAVPDWLFGNAWTLISWCGIQIVASFAEVSSLNGTVWNGSVADSIGKNVIGRTLDARESGIDERTEIRKFSADAADSLISSLASDTSLEDISWDTEIAIRDTIAIEEKESVDASPASNVICLILITKIFNTEVAFELETPDTVLTAINITKHQILAAVDGLADSLVQEIVGEAA